MGRRSKGGGRASRRAASAAALGVCAAAALFAAPWLSSAIPGFPSGFSRAADLWRWREPAIAAALVFAAAASVAAIGFRRGGGIPFFSRIRARPSTGSEDGYVYVLSNPSMPGLVKIGFTERHPRSRAEELRTSGVPTAFVLEHALRSSFARRIEAQAHRLMRDERVATDREFARLSPKAARDLVARAERHVKAAMSVGGR